MEKYPLVKVISAIDIDKGPFYWKSYSSRIVIHEHYDPSNHDHFNDIALIKTKDSAPSCCKLVLVKTRAVYFENYLSSKFYMDGALTIAN